MALRITSLIILSFMLFACKQNSAPPPLHIVFVTGDEEYRSEESMPMLAGILKRELNAKISICYSLDTLGFIDPNRTDHISGLSALENADLMVLFTRFRNLPDQELQSITSYVESGKPIVGFRTSTHAFLYENDSSKVFYNNQWPASVFGQQWITHHGHFEDGSGALTSVSRSEDANNHPILRGVDPFDAYSWLYHVEGGEWKLNGDCTHLLYGKALQSNHEINGKLDEYPLNNPIAWTKTYHGRSNNLSSRVFFTTLGHPYDFKIASMRKLALNGILWALSLEENIPEGGTNADFVSPYDPNNSGFGKKYKLGQKPKQIK
ncbi:MAG: ThuA domain-containing protein [Saprospiraceae bacterium]|nr:ThuA domain-containing protein [Saprospiraceae bacterium]